MYQTPSSTPPSGHGASNAGGLQKPVAKTPQQLAEEERKRQEEQAKALGGFAPQTPIVADTRPNFAKVGSSPPLSPFAPQPGGPSMGALEQVRQAALTDLNAPGRTPAGFEQGMVQQQGTRDAQVGFGVPTAVDAGQVNAGSQQQLIQLLSAGALGFGPSAAQSQFQGNLDQVIAAQRSASGGIRGQSAAAASRNAGIAGTNATLQAASGAASLRAQEQQGAQQLLGSTLQGARSQDIASAELVNNVLAGIRGQDITATSSNANVGMQQQELDDLRRRAAAGDALAISELEQRATEGNQKATLDSAQLQQQYDLARRGLELAQTESERQFWMQIIGSVVSSGAAVGAAAIGAPGAPKPAGG